MEKPLATVYYVSSEAPIKINQLTVNFPETEKFNEVAKRVTQYLGRARAPGTFSPR